MTDKLGWILTYRVVRIWDMPRWREIRSLFTNLLLLTTAVIILTKKNTWQTVGRVFSYIYQTVQEHDSV